MPYPNTGLMRDFLRTLSPRQLAELDEVVCGGIRQARDQGALAVEAAWTAWAEDIAIRRDVARADAYRAWQTWAVGLGLLAALFGCALVGCWLRQGGR